MGVILQMLSIGTESTRLVLVQILLQRKGTKLNPITSLYYISPCCFLFLAVPFFLLELPKIRNDPTVQFSSAVFLSNAAAAFGERWQSELGSLATSSLPIACSTRRGDTSVMSAALNMAVFLLIGKTSALTMNIAGVVKDWLLIGLSVMLFKCVLIRLWKPHPVRLRCSL